MSFSISAPIGTHSSLTLLEHAAGSTVALILRRDMRITEIVLQKREVEVVSGLLRTFLQETDPATRPTIPR